MSATHWIHHETFRPSPTLDRVNEQSRGLDLSSTFTRSSTKQRARENDVPLALVLRHDYNIQPSTHIQPARGGEMSTLLTHSATHVRSEPNPFTRTAASSFYAGTGVAPSSGAAVAVAARVFVKHADIQPTIEPQPIDPYLSVIATYPKQVTTKTTTKTTTKKATSTKSARPSTAKIRAQIEANQRLRARIAQQRADIATQRALELQEEAAVARYASRHIPPTPVIREMIQQDQRRASQQHYTQQPSQAWSERVPIQQVIYDHPQTVTTRPKTATARPRSASVKGKGERPSSANVRSAILDPPRGNDHFVLSAAIGFGKKHRHYNAMMKHLKSQPTVRQSQDDSSIQRDTTRTMNISASTRDIRPSSRDTSRTMNDSSSTHDLRPSSSSRDTTRARVSQHVEEKHMPRSQSLDPKMYQRSLMAASLGFGKAHENFHHYVRAYPEHME